jgi:hypothetical protein
MGRGCTWSGGGDGRPQHPQADLPRSFGRRLRRQQRRLVSLSRGGPTPPASPSAASAVAAFALETWQRLPALSSSTGATTPPAPSTSTVRRPSHDPTPHPTRIVPGEPSPPSFSATLGDPRPRSVLTTCLSVAGATVVSWRVNNQEQLFVR